ncbi:unnamed protein product [Scytosiphon promiscuus]
MLRSCPRGMEKMNGEDARKGQSLIRLSRKGMRRSCDDCGRKKKRCDGEQPCRRCVRSESQCNYSKRRWHHPDLPHQRHHQRQPKQMDRDAVHPRADLVHSTPGGPLEHRMLPFKRCTMRPSPATGLVGMEENAFLGDFFGCVGFMPLTTQSEIREAMVKIMVLAAPRPEPGSSVDCFGEGRRTGALFGGGMFLNVSDTNRRTKEPSLCTFWCAIAMGALAKGGPYEAVARYAQLAREALAASGSSSKFAEFARAAAILTYLHSFLGDEAKFREYLELSEYFVRAAMKQGSTDIQAGLPDLILHCRKVAKVQDGPMDSSWTREEGPPQMEKVFGGVDVYRFVAQSFRAFDQAVFAKAQEICADGLDGFYSGGPSHRSSDLDDPLPGDVSESIAAVLETTNSLEFDPLQEIADRPGIRGGVGSLLINGTLIFEKAVKGDLHATLEKLDRSVEVYERYPGLSRCLMSSHMSHMLLATLAAIDDSKARGMYDRLRGAVDSCRASHALPVPPFDEWQGMAAICSDLNCRSVETLIKSKHMKAFTALSVNSVHEGADFPKTAVNAHEAIQSETLKSAGVAHGDIPDPVQPGPNARDNWIGSDSPVEAACRVGPAMVPRASRFAAGAEPGEESANPWIHSGMPPWAPYLSPNSACSAGQDKDHTEPDDDEIAAADWLEVTHAMSDAVDTSSVG